MNWSPYNYLQLYNLNCEFYKTEDKHTKISIETIASEDFCPICSADKIHLI